MAYPIKRGLSSQSCVEFPVIDVNQDHPNSPLPGEWLDIV
jgi:hypothetical protein